MFRAKQQKVNGTGLYMSEGMYMCRCAIFAVLSPCTAVSG